MTAPGTPILTVAHDGPVNAIAFSADSARFASGGQGTKVLIRAVKTGPPLDILVNTLLGVPPDQPARGAVVASIAFSPDGALLAIGVDDQVVVVSAATGTVSWRGAIEASSSINFVAFTPDGKEISATTDTHIAVLDAQNGRPLGGRDPIVEDQTIVDVDLSADGKLVAVAIDERHGGDHHNAGSARVIDLTTGSERGRLTPPGAVVAVTFSPDATKVLCGCADDTTRMFTADSSAKELWSPPVGWESTGVAFEATGTWTLVAADDTARILEAASGVENTDARVQHDGAVTHVAFSRNGKWAASVGIDDVVAVVAAQSGVKHFPPQTTTEVSAMRFSPDSRWLGLGRFGDAVVLDMGAAG